MYPMVPCNNPLTRSRMYLRKCVIIQKSTGSSVYMILLGASGFPLRKAPLYSEILIFLKESDALLSNVLHTSVHDSLDKTALFLWENVALLERRILQCSNNSCEITWNLGKMHSSVEVAVLLEEGRIISKESVYSNACIKDHSVLSSAVHWIFSSKPRICCLQV